MEKKNEMRFGFAKDELILRRGELIVIGGRPDSGKSSLVLNMFKECINDSAKSYLYVHNEQKKMTTSKLQKIMGDNFTEAYNESLLSSEDFETFIDVSYVTKNWEFEMFIEANNIGTKNDESVLFENDGSVYKFLRGMLLKRIIERKVDILFIDGFTGVLNVLENNKIKKVSPREAGDLLKRLAVVFDITIVVTCWLDHWVDKRVGNFPQMGDLGEFSSLEFDADQLWLLYRGEYYQGLKHKESAKRAKEEGREYRSNYFVKPQEEIIVSVIKNKNGQTIEAITNFYPKTMVFKYVEPVIMHGLNERPKEAKISMPPL